MRKLRIILLALVLTACGMGATTETSVYDPPYKKNDSFGIFTWHDDEKLVTCWLYSQGGGISCIPDWQLKDPSND